VNVGPRSATPEPPEASAEQIAEAVRRLRAGGVVAFPTETVFGLGADAESEAGIAAIYRIKRRPVGHPLIVHVPDRAGAQYWAEIGPRAAALIESFWPGPLTLVLTRRAGVASLACGKESTVGLRCPSHPVARRLLAAFVAAGGHGIAAPSANLFGRVSPTSVGHVFDDLGAETPLVLEGGDSEHGVESTIVDLSRGFPALLRPGSISAAEIEAVLQEPLEAPGAAAPRVAGSLAAHYATATALELVAPQALAERVAQCLARGERIAVWSRRDPHAGAAVLWEPAPAEPVAYARRLYATLRRLDSQARARILVEEPPAEAQWAAVRDRLGRAQAGAGRS
jgi:L-threonylcarbamoyladenylate synthase